MEPAGLASLQSFLLERSRHPRRPHRRRVRELPTHVWGVTCLAMGQYGGM